MLKCTDVGGAVAHPVLLHRPVAPNGEPDLSGSLASPKRTQAAAAAPPNGDGEANESVPVDPSRRWVNPTFEFDYTARHKKALFIAHPLRTLLHPALYPALPCSFTRFLSRI